MRLQPIRRRSPGGWEIFVLWSPPPWTVRDIVPADCMQQRERKCHAQIPRTTWARKCHGQIGSPFHSCKVKDTTRISGMKLRLQSPSIGLCYTPVFLQKVLLLLFPDVRISLYRIAGTSLVDEYTRGSRRPGTVRMSERLLLQPPPRLFHVACQINVFLLLIPPALWAWVV